jgi:DNA-binding NtrC family response regulator
LKTNFNILLVEDMESFRGAVSQLLGVYNDVDEAEDLATARGLLRKKQFEVVILDRSLPDGDGTNLISEIKERDPKTVVVVLTSDSDISSIKHAMAKGADDYVIKTENCVPDLLVRIPVAVSKAAANLRLKTLEQTVKDAFRYELVGKSPSTIELREMILNLKGTNAHVLITGESGTGKELIARRLHSVEGEEARPFVAINCGAISEQLIESELFGHKKGAFTGALQDHAGKFEIANGGDLFFDEIGEMPLSAQTRLLRAIQEGEVTRVGDHRTIPSKCRIIAATNRDLELMVRKGKFREDLYHRLNVVNIHSTPLRQRIEDIPDIVKLFTLQIGGPNYKIANSAIRALSDYEWPGNIRELRNAVERAIISSKRRRAFEISFEDILVRREKKDPSSRIRKLQAYIPTEIDELNPRKFKEFVGRIEREYFESALELTNGSAIELANRLGLARSTVFKKIKELEIVSKRKNIFPSSLTVRESRALESEFM